MLTLILSLLLGLVSSLVGQSTDSGVFDKLVKPDAGLSNKVILTIASGLYRLIQLALRFSESSLKPEVCINLLQSTLIIRLHLFAEIT